MINKYEYYREDHFGVFVGYIVHFFIVVDYMSLAAYIF